MRIKLFVVLFLCMVSYGCTAPDKYYGLWIIESYESDDSKFEALVGEMLGFGSDDCNVPELNGEQEFFLEWSLSKKGRKDIIFIDAKGCFKGEFEAIFINKCKLQLKNEEFSITAQLFGCNTIYSIGKE